MLLQFINCMPEHLFIRWKYSSSHQRYKLVVVEEQNDHSPILPCFILCIWPWSFDIIVIIVV